MNYISRDVSTKDLARLYSRKGFCCIPLCSVNREGCECGDLLCELPGMHPLGNIADEATSNEEEIRSFLLRTPLPNLGIVTGSAGNIIALVCSLIDSEASESLGHLVKEYELSKETAAIETPFHTAYLYRIPGGVPILPKEMKSSMLLGMSLYGEGNYVMAEPSRLEDSHKQVKWIRLSPILDIPRAVIDLFVREASIKRTPIIKAEVTPEMVREHLSEFYRHLRACKFPKETVFEIMSGRNKEFSNPLSDKDLSALISAVEFMYIKEV